MKIAVYPFASTDDIKENLSHIHTAATLAAKEGVRLLAFHECALCCYPPLETTVDKLNPAQIRQALHETAALAKERSLFLAVGAVRYEDGRRYNSMAVFSPAGRLLGFYDKSALWGWDADNFTRGALPGIFEIEGVRVGFRICFDVRFPELFRSLYLQNADLCVVSFSDAQPEPSPERYAAVKSYLTTRAMENVMPVVSVNTLSGNPTAPTAVFDENGRVLQEADYAKECLLLYDYQKPPVSFGSQGRLINNDLFLANKLHSEKLPAPPIKPTARN